jgi:uncharacterized membrane protein
MRITSAGHVVFAAVMIALGLLGLVKSEFAAIWQPIPVIVPALAYVSAIVSLACGVGLLWRRTAGAAGAVLLVYLLLWLLLVRVPGIFLAPNVEYWWAACKTSVMAAAAWVVNVWLADEWDRRRLGAALGNNGLRIATVLYGAALVPFGLAHFLYVKQTAVLVPAWLPWHVGWAYFTGCSFITAGLAIVVDLCARVAAALSALQMGMFTLLVWVPIIAARSPTPFQWTETVVSAALTAAAWVVADSYRGVPWLALRSRSFVEG